MIIKNMVKIVCNFKIKKNNFMSQLNHKIIIFRVQKNGNSKQRYIKCFSVR